MTDVALIAGLVGGIGGLILTLLLVSWLLQPAVFSLAGKVVVVTGGSSGIGKAIAKDSLRRGAHVAIIARKPSLLEAAVKELQATAMESRGTAPLRVTSHAVDVSNDAAVVAAFADIAAAHERRVDVLINSAGITAPKTFADCGAEEFESMYRVNVVGTRNATHAALQHMNAPEGGRIVFVSSQAGQTGIYGYSAYSASKFALRGMFESLSQELYPRKILLSLAFPPDTDTPMLAEENKIKPAITRLLSEATATVQPEVVARGIIDGIVRWHPYISVGFDGWMLSTLTVGMGPAGSLSAALLQISTLWLWRLVALCYTQSFYWTVSRHSSSTATAATRGGNPDGSSNEGYVPAPDGGGGGGKKAPSATKQRRSSGNREGSK